MRKVQQQYTDSPTRPLVNTRAVAYAWRSSGIGSLLAAAMAAVCANTRLTPPVVQHARGRGWQGRPVPRKQLVGCTACSSVIAQTARQHLLCCCSCNVSLHGIRPQCMHDPTHTPDEQGCHEHPLLCSWEAACSSQIFAGCRGAQTSPLSHCWWSSPRHSYLCQHEP